MERQVNGGRTVLCAANSYIQKFYINPDFSTLPERVRQELQIISVMYVEEVGGILTLVFEKDGTLFLEVSHEEGDYLFDEIGSVLKIKQIQNEKQEFISMIELYYRTIHGLPLETDENDRE